MSGIKISQMPQADKINNEDYIPIIQEGVNKKASAKDLKGTEILIQNTEPENKDAIWVDPSEKNKPDYNNLKNKPSINGHELTGNQTSSQLGIEVPTKTSQLQNDSDFLEAEVTSYDLSFNLPVAKQEGTNLLFAKGVGGGSYTLPTATESTLGGVKVVPITNKFNTDIGITEDGVIKAKTPEIGGIPLIGNKTVADLKLIGAPGSATVDNCDTWLTNGFIKTHPNTSNLPTTCTGSDKWGVLFFVAENLDQGTGIQAYFPIDGDNKGNIFIRSLTRMKSTPKAIGEWKKINYAGEPTKIDEYQQIYDSDDNTSSDLTIRLLDLNYSEIIGGIDLTPSRIDMSPSATLYVGIPGKNLFTLNPRSSGGLRSNFTFSIKKHGDLWTLLYQGPNGVTESQPFNTDNRNIDNIIVERSNTVSRIVIFGKE